MKPGTLPMRASSRPICQLCDHILQRPGLQRRFLATKTLQAPARRPLPAPQRTIPITLIRANISTSRRKKKEKAARIALKEAEVVEEAAPAAAASVDPDIQTRYNEIHVEFKEAERQADAILSTSDTVPSEESVVYCFKQLGVVAQIAIEIQAAELGKLSLPAVKQSSAASLLCLDEDSPAPPSSAISPAELPTPNQISELAYKLVKHPTVFLSENVLRLYVQLHALLNRPATFPEIFEYYARKPIPRAGTSPVKYTYPKPKSPRSAIPKEIAEVAITAAINSKSMGLCLDVIEASYVKSAFYRNKLLRRTALPAFGITLLPLGVWNIAQEASLYSPAMDPDLLAKFAFAGGSAYCLYALLLGYVAITTSNDQMDRVVWVPGTPLYKRWLKEEERAALDRVAQAWGFKERWRRGEEEGEDWESLREWCFLKSMILDKTELMDGMQ